MSQTTCYQFLVSIFLYLDSYEGHDKETIALGVSLLSTSEDECVFRDQCIGLRVSSG